MARNQSASSKICSTCVSRQCRNNSLAFGPTDLYRHVAKEKRSTIDSRARKLVLSSRRSTMCSAERCANDSLWRRQKFACPAGYPIDEQRDPLVGGLIETCQSVAKCRRHAQ